MFMDADFAKAQFKSSMAIIRYLTDKCDRDIGEFIFRALMETCRHLSRKFNFTIE